MFEGFAAHRASEQHFDLINGLIYEVGETMAKRKHFGITASGLAFALLFAIVPALSVSGCAQTGPYVIAASGTNSAIPAATSDETDETILTIKKRVDEVHVLFIATDPTQVRPEFERE